MLGVLLRNGAEVVDTPRTRKHEVRTLTWEEVAPFLHHVEDPQYKTLFLLVIQTRLRRSVVLSLRWRDVYFQNGILAVRRAWVKLPSGSKTMSETKSVQSRVVDLPAQCVDDLRNQKEDRGDFQGMTIWFFAIPTETPWTRTSFQKIQEACRGGRPRKVEVSRPAPYTCKSYALRERESKGHLREAQA